MPRLDCVRALARAAAVTLAALLQAPPGHAAAPGASLEGRTMGTFYRITLSAHPAAPTLDALGTCVRRALGRIDALMSTWRDDSELSRFNASAGTGLQPASAATVAVVREALRVSDITGGAFDPTVAPLLALWGFGPEARDDAPLPGRLAVAEARSRIGYRRLRTQSNPAALGKTVGDIQVDLSAVAKGYAVDVLATLAERHGVTSYLVNIGGEMRAAGAGRNGHGWRIGIESPTGSASGVIRVLGLRRAALATSGTYRRYREHAGRRLADTIDPRTGAPVTHDLRMVSVVDTRAARADALATGLLVLGARDALALARHHDIAAVLVRGNEGDLQVQVSPAFARLDPDAVSVGKADDTDAMKLIQDIGCRR